MVDEINKKGDQIFFNPSPTCSYDYLVRHSLGSNTFRGFHRIDQTEPGASQSFRKVLLKNKEKLIQKLNTISEEEELNYLSNELCAELKQELEKNIIGDQLKPYNKIRKPVDIFIEHIIAMGVDFKIARERITKFLFLPLDSHMFQSDFVFPYDEINQLRIKRSFTYGSISSEQHYQVIQLFLLERSIDLNLNARIYFDLLWNGRYKSNGKNLLDTNPPKKFRDRWHCS